VVLVLMPYNKQMAYKIHSHHAITWKQIDDVYSMAPLHLSLSSQRREAQLSRCHVSAQSCSLGQSIECSLPCQVLEREREIYFKSHISLWEHSSHFRLIGRGVPSVSVVSQLMYKFLCLASPKENPQVPM